MKMGRGKVAYLEIPATAVNVLLVLHGELHDERLAGVRELLRELGRHRVEVRVLRRLHTCKL